MKLMYVEHKQWTEGETRYEETKIFAPGISVKPVHTLDRHMPTKCMTDVEAALQSLHFGEILAGKFSDKYKAEGVSLKSNVPNAANLYMALGGPK